MAQARPQSPPGRDQLARLWPLLLVAVGIIWLLVEIRVISAASIAILLTYWPILLVGIGLDYFLGRQARPGIPFTLIAVAALLVLMAIGPTLGLSRGPNVVTERFSEPLGSAESARISLDLASAPTRVFSLQDETLIDANLTHTGTIEFDVRGDQLKEVQLRRIDSPARFDFGFLAQRRWDIGLSRDLPLNLRIDVGSGRAILELEDLDLTALELDGGSGSMALKLPPSQTTTRYQVELDAGSGSTDLTVADRAALDMVVDVGSGSFSADLGREVSLDLELSGGSGSTRIDVPGDAAVRLEVRDDGSGSLRVGGRLDRVSGEGDRGVWETRDFAEAEQQIVITVRSAGSGSISIR